MPSSSEAVVKASPPGKSSKPTSLRTVEALGEDRVERTEATHFILETPSTKPTTHGSTLTPSLVTRKGTFATSALRKSVSRCFAASFCA